MLGACLALVACMADGDELDSQHLESGSDTALVWLGDTHLRVGEVWLPPTLAPAAGRELPVYTQTYPSGAADAVELFWADASYADVRSTRMELDTDGAGIFGMNSQWRATIPADAVVADQDLVFWIRAEDRQGNVLWDSRNGANHRVRPQRYDAAWIGGLGSFRPINGDYVVGGLFFDDDSTSTGCWNHGVSASSYRSRAARVWIPGLSDRDLDEHERAAAAAMVRFEVFTDASADGIRSIPARLVRRDGNDFLYQFQFVSFNPGCILGLDAGTYHYKLRASTDDGASWFWRGNPVDGDYMLVQYAERCSYFNNPFDCIPTETELTRGLDGGAVQAFHEVAIGASSTFTKSLRIDTRPVTVGNIALTGPDADQYRIAVFDVGRDEYVDAEGPFDLDVGDELRLILVYAPTAASPGVALPHVATVEWDERSPGAPGARDVTGIHMRGTTAAVP